MRGLFNTKLVAGIIILVGLGLMFLVGFAIIKRMIDPQDDSLGIILGVAGTLLLVLGVCVYLMTKKKN